MIKNYIEPNWNARRFSTDELQKITNFLLNLVKDYKPGATFRASDIVGQGKLNGWTNKPLEIFNVKYPKSAETTLGRILEQVLHNSSTTYQKITANGKGNPTSYTVIK